uniref:hypothetical protein n=1 Tax=Serratia marcescens TaxID=615 RepID=UPI001EECA7F1|nr:hypothetical protein [Serratia marcescens]
MTYVFNACVGDWLRDGHLQLKDLWNVLMYAIPLIFIALSGGLAVAGGVYAILNSLYTKGQMFILKRKMGKLALQASREVPMFVRKPLHTVWPPSCVFSERECRREQ